jgi:hypothetical protein
MALAGLALAAFAAGIQAQGEPLFSETFTGPYQSSPAGWTEVNTPEGNFWYLRDGKYTTGNGDVIRAQDKRTYAVVQEGLDTDWSDYEVIVDAYMIQRNGGLLLTGRWTDARNHYEGVYETGDRGVTVRIALVSEGRTQVLAEATSRQIPSLPNLANGATPADGRQFRLRFEGDRISFFVDQDELIAATDSTISQGSAGVGQFENFVFFDNFRVLGLAPSPATTGTPTPIATTPQDVQRIFRLKVAEAWTREQATDYRRALEDMAFFPVILQESSPGRFDVLTGTFLSEDEANRWGNALLEEGDLIAFRVIPIDQSAAEELAEATREFAAYAVQAGRAQTQADADQMVTHLTTERDFFPVTSLPDGAGFKILVGNFSTTEDAQGVLRQLASGGFPNAQVVEVPRRQLIEATPTTDVGVVADVLRSLPADQRERLEQMLEMERRLALGSNTGEQIQQMQEFLQEMRESFTGLRQSVDSIQQEAREREERDREVNRLIGQAESAIDARQWESAAQIIAQVHEIDPTNATARLLETRVRAATASGGQTQDRESQIIAQAMEYENAGELQRARVVLELGRDQFPTNQQIAAEYQRVDNAVQRQREQAQAEQDRLAQQQSETRSSQSDKRLLLFGAVGVVALCVIIALLVQLMRREKALRTQLSAISSRGPVAATPMAASATYEEAYTDPEPRGGASFSASLDSLAPSSGGGIGLDPHEADQDISVLSSRVLATVKEATPPEPDAPVVAGAKSARKRPGTPSPDKPESSRVSLDFGSDEDTGGGSPKAETTKEEKLAPISEGGEMGFINFSDDEETKQPEKLPSSDEGPALQDITPFDDPFGGGENIDIGMGSEPPTSPSIDIDLEGPPLDGEETLPSVGGGAALIGGAALAGASGGSSQSSDSQDGVVFTQNFSAAEAGEQPDSWSGDYEFASLKVSTENKASGSEASLRFEKRTGAGSALYSCRFPEAKGNVAVEFDLCCESKNQYLLGIYFEHDGNFRQSVHTVIHVADGGVSLRLQGKSIDYEFGTWVHVKYLIDLSLGVVDGVVNGQKVATRVPMVSMPEQSSPPSINTISIRDTLASEGVFYLDNIRIQRA